MSESHHAAHLAAKQLPSSRKVMLLVNTQSPSTVSASPDVLTELNDYLEESDEDEDTTMLDSEKEEEEKSL